MDEGIKRCHAVDHCLESFSIVLGFNLVELWIQAGQEFTLARIHTDEIARKVFADSLESYQSGMKEKASSHALCKKALETKEGFYWRMQRNSDLHRDFPIHTAVSFHLSRDNINTNVFVVAYSLDAIKYTQSKLSFIHWLSHATSCAAFSSSLYDNVSDIRGGTNCDTKDDDTVDGVVQLTNAILGDQLVSTINVEKNDMVETRFEHDTITLAELEGVADKTHQYELDSVVQRFIDDDASFQYDDYSVVSHMKSVAKTSETVGVYSIEQLASPRPICKDVELEELVGLEFVTEGSSCTIFSAVWKNQPVIIKMVSREKADDEIALCEFEVECELLIRIEHKNIIKALGTGTKPLPFVILESLRDLTVLLDLNTAFKMPRQPSRRRAFAYSELLVLARELADAMHYLHERVHPHAMIIHRDIKPENIGLTSDGHLKLFDFGLCRCMLKRTSSTQVYKMTGRTGSLRYMAPEVALHLPYNEKVDQYSFGIVLWTVARNKPPYVDFNSETHHQRVVLDGVRPKLEKGWPQNFRQLLEECWHRDPTQRPSFGDICTKLDYMIDDLKAQQAAPAAPSPRPSPMGLLRVFSPSSNTSKK